jgi:hypothetical protein
VRLADEITRATGTAPRIRLGGFGALDVFVDGRVVYSKKAEGRLLSPGEIAGRMKGTG